MWVNTLGAMAGGVVEACTLQPLDVLKTRMQMAPPGATLAGTASGMFKNEGTLAFYKGLSPFVAHLVLKYATRWHFNEFYRGCMAGKDGNVSRSATFLAGLGAGLTEAVLIVTPFEVTKTRLQTQTGTDKAALKYKNPIHCVQTIIAEEGPAALWKGNLPCMFRQGWNAFFLFGTYDSLKKLVLGKERDEKISGHQSLTLGIIAGMCCPAWRVWACVSAYVHAHVYICEYAGLCFFSLAHVSVRMPIHNFPTCNILAYTTCINTALRYVHT